jgi:streptomycin 3"-adenylyltransferase
MNQDMRFAATSQADPAALDAALATSQALARALGDNLFAAYLHGSAVLGGYRSDRSDLDVLAITNGALADYDIEAVVAALGGEVYPTKGLEISLLTRSEAALPDAHTPRFQLHVATSGIDGAIRVVDGRQREGDRDLILHFAVCRAAGLTLLGPPPNETLASIPASDIRRAMLDEIDWAAAAAPPAYLVLTCARAWLFAVTDRIASKVDAGEWAAERYPATGLIKSALTLQRGGETEVDSLAALEFARYVGGVIRQQLPDEHAELRTANDHY